MGNTTRWRKGCFSPNYYKIGQTWLLWWSPTVLSHPRNRSDWLYVISPETFSSMEKNFRFQKLRFCVHPALTRGHFGKISFSWCHLRSAVLRAQMFWNIWQHCRQEWWERMRAWGNAWTNPLADWKRLLQHFTVFFISTWLDRV